MPFAGLATFEKPAAYDAAEIKSIPGGVAGTRATLFEIERLVQVGKKAPEVAELAEYIFDRYDARPYDYPSQIRAVHSAVKEGLFYVFDPRGIETLRDPRKIAAKMLAYFRGAGPRPLADCDDYTIIARSLLEYVGLETRGRAIGTKKWGKYNHALPMVRIPHGPWVGVEATIPGARAGWVPPSTKARPMDVPAALGQGYETYTAKLIAPFKKSASEILERVLPPTLRETMKPAVEQLQQELKWLRWAFLGVGLAALGVGYYFIRRAHRRAAA